MSDGIVIVGGGAAAQTCAFGLRRRGHEGPVTIVSREQEPPYDRTLLSKEYLTGSDVAAELHLEAGEAYERESIELMLGRAATGLDLDGKRVLLDDGGAVAYEKLVIASGREAVLPASLEAEGVLTVRELADARRLRETLERPGRTAIIGGGFIGLELAATLRKAGREVIVLEGLAEPFSRGVGPLVGSRIATMHREHGVELLVGKPVAEIVRSERGYALGVEGGDPIECDTVVVAVGAQPALGWLAETPLAGPSILTGPGGETEFPSVYAAGDCTRWTDAEGNEDEVEHWEVARAHGEATAAGILGEELPARPLPYFWSEQYGIRFQALGRLEGADHVDLEHPGETVDTFVARYFRDGVLCGVFAANEPAALTSAREELEGARTAAPEADTELVLVDRDVCIGNGRCVRMLPAVFELDDEGIATVSDPESADPEKLRSAALACPSGAIHLRETA